MNTRIRPWHRLLALAIGAMVFAVFAPTDVSERLRSGLM